MPNLNGELLSKILRKIGYKGIIIGITGNGLKTDKDQYLKNGADHIFIKPFTRENLSSIVKIVQKEGYDSKDDKKIVENNGVFEWI
jgi:DNA-binding response OmpR family regulator